MMIDQYLFKQVFSVAIAAVLLITFYIVLAIDMATPTQNFIEPLLLIIISVTALAIFSEIVNLGEKISLQTKTQSKKVKKRR